MPAPPRISRVVVHIQGWMRPKVPPPVLPEFRPLILLHEDFVMGLRAIRKLTPLRFNAKPRSRIPEARGVKALAPSSSWSCSCLRACSCRGCQPPHGRYPWQTEPTCTLTHLKNKCQCSKGSSRALKRSLSQLPGQRPWDPIAASFLVRSEQ